jgi:hypothetical protein
MYDEHAIVGSVRGLGWVVDALWLDLCELCTCIDGGGPFDGKAWDMCNRFAPSSCVK